MAGDREGAAQRKATGTDGHVAALTAGRTQGQPDLAPGETAQDVHAFGETGPVVLSTCRALSGGRTGKSLAQGV